MKQLKSSGKPFDIPKWEVCEAFQDVRRNQGAPGVDAQSIADFESDLKGNLYKIWNRMSSGTDFPPPVRAVEIPKQHGGGMRSAVAGTGDREAEKPAADRAPEQRRRRAIRPHQISPQAWDLA
ncbi:group II intron reverse transcriptase/maturase [Streptomyces olivochromogenes]|uniref:Group II intron reverse transcriptase/maturase n=2 Tax=Streptomyces olivochromogenes TaxID=1963 RepID=A0A286PGD6_STROL|nr:group II intron reverse transcriptase/maturase [Streptomyces olivochromogenes]